MDITNHESPRTETQDVLDVNDCNELCRGISARELRAAGIELDASTDDDVGPDECRITASIDTDSDGRYRYGVQFLQLTLAEAVAGRAPRWRYDRRANAFQWAIKRLFTDSEMAEISAAREEA